MCSSLIGNFPTESIVLNPQLVVEMENLCNLLEGSLKNVASKSVQPISQPGCDALDFKYSIGLQSSRPNYVPQRSMTFHNSKYKKFHQAKMSPKNTFSNQNCVSKSSVISEPENLVSSDSYTPSKSSIVANYDILDVPCKVVQIYTSGTEPQTENFIHGGNVECFSSDVCTGKSKSTVSSVSEEQTSYIETNLPRNVPDQCNWNALFSNSRNTASRYLSTSSEESIFDSGFPISFPDMFEMLESLPSDSACGTSGMPVLSKSCNVESNQDSACHIPHVTHVRTENLVDVEVYPQKLECFSNWLPPPPPLPIEEVLAALDRLSAKDRPG